MFSVCVCWCVHMCDLIDLGVSLMKWIPTNTLNILIVVHALSQCYITIAFCISDLMSSMTIVPPPFFAPRVNEMMDKNKTKRLWRVKQTPNNHVFCAVWYDRSGSGSAAQLLGTSCSTTQELAYSVVCWTTWGRVSRVTSYLDKWLPPCNSGSHSLCKWLLCIQEKNIFYVWDTQMKNRLLHQFTS